MNYGKKTIKGDYYTDSQLVGLAKRVICTVDSGMGETMVISQEHENPLFESQEKNRVNLLIHFPQGIARGRKYQFPDSSIQVCYYEKGDLLMFHTFEAEGSISFDAGTGASEITGRMDLKLVRPYHNMSNSDYHYLGDRFLLRKTALNASTK